MLKLKTDSKNNLMFEIVNEENSLSRAEFSVNLGGSKPEILENNIYLVYNKGKFEIKQLKNSQKTLWIIKYIENKYKDFKLDKTFFRYWIIYYQRDGQTPYLKKYPKNNIENLNTILKNLETNLQWEIENNYVKIVWEITEFSKIKESILNTKDSNKLISFLLWNMIWYGKITTIDTWKGISLKNILLDLPFDTNLFYEKEIIFYIEEKLIESGLYNKVFDNVLSIKFNLMDYELIDIIIDFIKVNELEDYFQIWEGDLTNMKKNKLMKIQEECKKFLESSNPQEIEIGKIDYNKIKSLPIQKIRSSF